MDCLQGEISVVGNGPLKEEDRVQIEQSSCVVRFNDLKNYRKGEKIDIHAMRSPFSTITGSVNMTSCPAIAVIEQPQQIKDYQNHDVIMTIGAQIQGGSKFDDTTLFPDCDRCSESSRPCEHSSSRYGPSTGGIVLSELDKMPNITTIHVYGMNWNNYENDNHIDFKYPTLVSDCCKKCVFHPTFSSKYT